MFLSSLVVIDGDEGDRVRVSFEGGEMASSLWCGLCVKERWVNCRANEDFGVWCGESGKGGGEGAVV